MMYSIIFSRPNFNGIGDQNTTINNSACNKFILHVWLYIKIIYYECIKNCNFRMYVLYIIMCKIILITIGDLLLNTYKEKLESKHSDQSFMLFNFLVNMYKRDFHYDYYIILGIAI